MVWAGSVIVVDGVKFRKFKRDRRQIFKAVTTVNGPTGQITFSGPVVHLVVKDMNKKGAYIIEDMKCNFDVEIGVDMLLDCERNSVFLFDKANNELSRVEQIKKFRILPHKLYEEEGDVTPTMKVKRKFINEKYKDLINEMYRG